MPMVINPENRKFGHSCLTCFASSKHSDGSTPDLAAITEKMTQNGNLLKLMCMIKLYQKDIWIKNSLSCFSVSNKSTTNKKVVAMLNLQASPLVFTCTRTFNGCLPSPLTARSKWFATCKIWSLISLCSSTWGFLSTPLKTCDQRLKFCSNLGYCYQIPQSKGWPVRFLPSVKVEDTRVIRDLIQTHISSTATNSNPSIHTLGLIGKWCERD